MGYAVQLNLSADARALVVGGGAVAAQKIEALAASGVRLVVIAKDLSPAVEAQRAAIERLELREAREEDVEGMALVIAATDDRDLNARLAEAARARGILVNAVDDPRASTFFAPAIVRRGPVTLAISTDGASPLLSAQLRRVLEAAIPRSVSAIGDFFTRIRARGLRGLAQRKKLLRALADPALSRLVESDRTEEAEVRLEDLMREEEEPFPAGTVAIVGAGPGSKELLTLRALDRIQRAEVILHDALVDHQVLALALPGTRIIDVGRRCVSDQRTEQRTARSRSGDPRSSGGAEPPRSGGTSMELALALLLREAKSGARVVRLHAGDPFVFGRGGEEIDALEAAGIRYEMVPGVSAALAAPAAAGIPLTRRGEARGFTVRTGHDTSGYTAAELPLEEETLVVLMGLGGARALLAKLVEDGLPADTPAAAISNATRETQRVVAGTVADLAERIEAAALASPATLVIGKVARRAKAGAEARAGEAAA